MSKRKNGAFAEFMVGLFMIVVIALLAYFTIVISGVDVLRGDSKVQMRVRFDQVGGLKDHDSVMYRGTKVGSVDEVLVTPSNLVVVASVNRNVILRSGYRISVCNLSMLGGNYLFLEEGIGEPVELSAQIFDGEAPTDWMRDVATVAHNLKQISELKEIRSIVTNVEAVSVKANAFTERANAIAAKIDSVVSRCERGEGTFGKLMSADETLYNDLKAALADARGVMAKLNEAKMYEDLKATIADARGVMAKLNRDQLYDDFSQGVAAFRTSAESFNAKETMTRANALLENLNAIALKLKNGEGTLGRLANDSEMYDQVNALIKDARQVLDNYRDTTPITTFSSLATGAL